MKTEQEIREQMLFTQQLINAYQDCKEFQDQINCAFQQGVHSAFRWVLSDYEKGGKS